ncbi:GIY-YIG nuclease family protein [Micromonospora haikouensis]|uniref:GIY-YIG nuclease family protein n=1 Tax=Micromonospora haikouensis TaxID=686309 RepID=UPI00343BE1DA
MGIHESGLIYYALDATIEGVRVKIGFTTNLRQRMASLRRWVPSRQTPIVLAVEEGTRVLEGKRHAQFADLRIDGEWFQYADAMASFLAGLEKPYDVLSHRHDLRRFAGGWLSMHYVDDTDRSGPIWDLSLEWGRP